MSYLLLLLIDLVEFWVLDVVVWFRKIIVENGGVRREILEVGFSF